MELKGATMRFHPLALPVVIGALCPSLDAFVLPKGTAPISVASSWQKFELPRRFAKSADYTSLEENLAETPKRKPNKRAEKLRASLESDLAAAEEARALKAKQLAEAESSRLALEAEAAKATQEAEALGAKLRAFEAKQAAAGAGIGATVGEIAAPLVGGFAALGGLAVARDTLAARNQKVEEERLQREVEKQKAEEAAKKKAAQQAQSKTLMPIVGAGVAGLGAFGALFAGGGGETTVDSMSKITQDAPQKIDGSVTTPIADPSVEMPYLEKEIAKAEETKKKPPRKDPRAKPKSSRQLAQEALDEQRAMEARLEQKLAEAPELARNAAEAQAEDAKLITEAKAVTTKAMAEQEALEAQQAAAEKLKAEKLAADKLAFEKIKAESEKAAAEADAKLIAEAKAVAAKAIAEQEALEAQRAAAERLKAEKLAADKLAFEKIKAEEKAKADKLAADLLEQQRAAEEQAKAEKIAADKLAFEKMREEEEAKLRAEETAALESLKQQEAEFRNIFPKVPAVSEMLFGNKKPSETTDKGLSNMFGPGRIVVGGVALAGLAVAAAIAAANDEPSVKSTFKVTGKTPKEFLESKDNSNSTPPVSAKKTLRIPKVDEPNSKPFAGPTPTVESNSPKVDPPKGSKEALREQLAKQRESLNKQQANMEESKQSETSDVQPPASSTSSSQEMNTDNMRTPDEAFIPPSMKKSYSPFGTKPKAASRNPLYSPPSLSQTVTNDAPLASSTSSSVVQNDLGSDQSVPKKSYSPFGGSKPPPASSDSLYSPPSTSSGTIVTPGPQSVPEAPDPPPVIMENRSEEIKPDEMPKKSFSPFGGTQPKTSSSNSLYAPPSTQQSTYDESTTEPIVEPPKVSAIPTSMPKTSYSPFGSRKSNTSASDSLYSPPGNGFVPPEGGTDVKPFDLPETPEMAPEVPPPVKTSYSPFGGSKPFVSSNDSLYAAPSITSTETEESLPFAATSIDQLPSSSVPETSSFQVPAAKKSFSPFGSKPQGQTEPSRGSGGYLDGL